MLPAAVTTISIIIYFLVSKIYWSTQFRDAYSALRCTTNEGKNSSTKNSKYKKQKQINKKPSSPNFCTNYKLTKLDTNHIKKI